MRDVPSPEQAEKLATLNAAIKQAQDASTTTDLPVRSR